MVLPAVGVETSNRVLTNRLWISYGSVGAASRWFNVLGLGRKKGSRYAEALQVVRRPTAVVVCRYNRYLARVIAGAGYYSMSSAVRSCTVPCFYCGLLALLMLVGLPSGSAQGLRVRAHASHAPCLDDFLIRVVEAVDCHSWRGMRAGVLTMVGSY